jgi:hypothetical protein
MSHQTTAIIEALTDFELDTLQAYVEGRRLPPNSTRALKTLTEKYPLLSWRDLRPTDLGKAVINDWRATFGART